MFCSSRSNKCHVDTTTEVPGQSPGVWVPCPHSQAGEKKPETGQTLATGWFGWAPLGLDGDLGKAQLWWERTKLGLQGESPRPGLSPCSLGLSWLGQCSGPRTPRGLWPAPSPGDRLGWGNMGKSQCHGVSPCICLPAPPHPAPDLNGLLQIKSSHLNPQVGFLLSIQGPQPLHEVQLQGSWWHWWNSSVAMRWSGMERGSKAQFLLSCGPAGSEAVEIQVRFTLSHHFPAAAEVQL